eukprot:3755404-Pyramimonas_sp.AAC.1
MGAKLDNGYLPFFPSGFGFIKGLWYLQERGVDVGLGVWMCLRPAAQKSPFGDDSDGEEEEWFTADVAMPKPPAVQQTKSVAAPSRTEGAQPFFKTLEKAPFKDFVKEDDEDNDEDPFVSAPMPTAPVVHHSNVRLLGSLFLSVLTLPDPCQTSGHLHPKEVV